MKKAFLLLLILLVPVLVLAQDIASVQVNYPEAEEVDGDQQVTVYFTPLNDQGVTVPIPNGAGIEATINLGGEDYPATISVPEKPLDLVLVLDTSGSMRGAGDQMKNAAADAIRQAPQGTRFTVITFNEEIQQIVTSNDNQTQVADAIRGISTFNGGTCLFDATVQGLRGMQSTGNLGRRAMVVFTDGRDELIAGGELDPCSESDQNDVIDIAADPSFRVPVYTIGMRGGQPIAEQQLETVATSTGGRYVVGDQGQLTGLFGQVLAALLNQRAATATVCLEAGQYAGFIQVGGGFGNPISAPINGVNIASTCVVPTATPTLEAAGLAIRPPRPEDNELVFEIVPSGGVPPTSLNVTIIDGASNTLLPDPFGEIELAPADPVVRLPLDQITAAQLNISVEALDAEGEVLATAQLEDVQPQRTATPTPPPTPTPIEVAVTIPGIRYDDGRFTINVNAPADPIITGYEIRIIDQNGNLVDDITVLEPPSDPIVVDEETDLDAPLPPGQYRFVMELKIRGASPGDTLPTAEYQLTKLPPELPPWYVRFGTYLGNNLIALAGLVLIALAVIGSAIYFIFLRGGDDKEEDMPYPSFQSSSGGGGAQHTMLSEDFLPDGGMVSPAIMGQLRVERSNTLQVGQTYEINPNRTPVHIGNPNSSKAQGRNLLVSIPDESVSGVHVTVHFNNGQFTVVDEASSNGTQLDNDMMEPNRRYTLQREHTSEINVALNHVFSFRYVIDGVPQETPSTEPEDAPAPAAPMSQQPPAPSGSTGDMGTRRLASSAPPVGGRNLPRSEPQPQAPAPAPQQSYGGGGVGGASGGVPNDIAATLEIVQSPNMAVFPQRVIRITQSEFWIGRTDANALMIPETPISSMHACIRWENGQFTITDNSTNGTWLNGQRLNKGTAYPLPMNQGNRIELAVDCAVVNFNYTRQEATSPSTPPEPQRSEPIRTTKPDDYDSGTPPELPTASVPSSGTSSPRMPAADAKIPQGVQTELIVVEENGVPVNRNVPVSKANITIGRNSERDCVVRSLHVSRLHATLFWQDNKFYIMDNGSQNGVYVDNQPIQPNTPKPLEPMHMYTILLSRHTSEPTSLTFFYEDKRTAIIDFGGFDV